MPHIHTEPDQHDMTVSAYIIRRENDDWKCLVHFHRKIEKLMQIGGHIELNETPWQSVAHEIEEESGYEIKQLQVLQPTTRRVTEVSNLSHPVPFSMNTHNVGDDHYHSDMCLALSPPVYREICQLVASRLICAGSRSTSLMRL